MPGPWLYAIAAKAKNFFSFDDGSPSLNATTDNFRVLAEAGRLDEDPRWFVGQHAATVEGGDELFIYSGDKNIGIIGFAHIESAGGDKGARFVVPKFDYPKTIALLANPVPAAEVRSWKLSLRRNLVDLAPIRGRLVESLPSGFFRTQLVMAYAGEISAEELEQAVRENRLAIPIVPTDDAKRWTSCRVGQDQIRKQTLENYDGRCAVCDISDERLLIASHIVGWAKDPSTRGDLRNVVCLCRLHDALFEAGYWGLDDEMAPVVRLGLDSKSVRRFLRDLNKFRKPCLFPPDHRFTKQHRAQWKI
jgi:hypothetical protein